MREDFAFMDEVDVDRSKLPINYKFVQVDITKEMSTCIFLKVPDYFSDTDIRKQRPLIEELSNDIDEYEWEESLILDIDIINTVSEKLADRFGYSTVEK